MRGDRTNYGKKSGCRRIELRLYVEDRVFIETLAAVRKETCPQTVAHLIQYVRKQAWVPLAKSRPATVEKEAVVGQPD